MCIKLKVIISSKARNIIRCNTDDFTRLPAELLPGKWNQTGFPEIRLSFLFIYLIVLFFKFSIRKNYRYYDHDE